MTIREKAVELGEMIQNSDEMKRVNDAKIAQQEDETAKTLMIEFNMQRMNLARDMQNGKITQEEAIAKNNKAFDEMLEKSPVIKEFVESQKALEDLTTEVKNILTFYITGQDPNCTHDCSTCAGCH